MAVKIEESWKEALEEEFTKEYFNTLTDFVRNEYKTSKIYPPANKIFNAFNTTPFSKVKVVILGQDPYHGENQANGLAFSVNTGTKIPPSLRNIYKEIKSDTGEDSITTNGDLKDWAQQGVLLLNATLTVKASSPGSHQKQGWEQFTDTVVQKLSSEKNNLVFLLWGSYAQTKGEVINNNKHLVLKSPHPSPFSADRGFFGCKHFTLANAYLLMHDKDPIISW